MNNGVNMNILFYSKMCHTCITLVKMLETENLLQYFIMICVDDKLNKLPVHIDHVPTMIVKDQNKKLEAEETFEWIRKVKFLRQNYANAKNQIVKNNVLDSMNKNKLLGYTSTEMGSQSDIFSYVNEEAPALPQSFFGYDDEKNHTIFTAPEQDKLTQEEQKQMISLLENKRNSQDSHYMDISKKQQLNTIISMEQQKILDTYKKNMNNNTNISAVQNMQNLQYDKLKQMQMVQNKLQHVQKMNHMKSGNQ